MIAKARARVWWSACAVLLGFTLPAAADEASGPSARWVEDPYQPHDTRGTNLRAGSAVGYLFHDAERYTALGPVVAFGPRFGRVTVEASYLFAELSEPGPSTLQHGNVHRIGAMVRGDVVRIGPHAVGANSMLAVYAEGGVAQHRYHWYRPAYNERARAVPVDDNRPTVVLGFGLNLEHRLEQPHALARVGWQLGWQLTASDQRPMSPTLECRATTCVSGPVVMTGVARDTSLLVTSTLAFTW